MHRPRYSPQETHDSWLAISKSPSGHWQLETAWLSQKLVNLPFGAIQWLMSDAPEWGGSLRVQILSLTKSLFWNAISAKGLLQCFITLQSLNKWAFLNFCYKSKIGCTQLIQWVSQRSHGLVVRAAACEARGPGLNSTSDQMFFFSSGKEVGIKWIQTC